MVMVCVDCGFGGHAIQFLLNVDYAKLLGCVR